MRCKKGWVQVQVLFMGMGQMGRRMVRRLNRNTTWIWNRTTSVSTEMANGEGWRVAENLEEAVAASSVVITMLRDDQAVESVGRTGFYQALSPNTLWIDMTTGAPDATRRYVEIARWRQAKFVAAPVVGSLKPAEEGTLMILAGGDEDALTVAAPILSQFGRFMAVGTPEQALTVKLSVNAVLAFYVNGVAEALQLTDQVGLDRSFVLELLGSSSVGAPLLKGKARRWEQHDYTPEFSIGLLHKDLRLARSWAKSLSVIAEGINRIEEVYEKGAEGPWADRDMVGIAEALSQPGRHSDGNH